MAAMHDNSLYQALQIPNLTFCGGSDFDPQEGVYLHSFKTGSERRAGLGHTSDHQIRGMATQAWA